MGRVFINAIEFKRDIIKNVKSSCTRHLKFRYFEKTFIQMWFKISWKSWRTRKMLRLFTEIWIFSRKRTQINVREYLISRYIISNIDNKQLARFQPKKLSQTPSKTHTSHKRIFVERIAASSENRPHRCEKPFSPPFSDLSGRTVGDKRPPRRRRGGNKKAASPHPLNISFIFFKASPEP